MDVLELERSRFDAMIDADIERLRNLLDDRLLYTHSTAVVDTKQELISKIETGELTYRKIETAVRSRIEGGGATIVHYELTMDVEVKGILKRVSSQAASIWVDAGNAWKLALFHSTAIPQAPA